MLWYQFQTKRSDQLKLDEYVARIELKKCIFYFMYVYVKVDTQFIQQQ